MRSCALDGEAIVVNTDGLSVLDLIRYRHHDHVAVLCAFDLTELDGENLRREPVERRKAMLAICSEHPRRDRLQSALRGRRRGDFEHACSLGCEGIDSKRLGSAYRFGRVNQRLKIKNPAASAVRREAEEDWS